MKTAIRILGYLLLIALGIIMGGVIGGWLAASRIDGLFTRWEAFPLPDNEQAVRFVTYTDSSNSRGSRSDLYVATKQHKVLMLVEREEIWQEVDPIGATTPDETGNRWGWRWDGCVSENWLDERHQIRRPPGTVVDQLDCDFTTGEVSISHRYVILGSGQVWRWKLTGHAMGDLVITFYYILWGAIVGGILGVVGSIYYSGTRNLA